MGIVKCDNKDCNAVMAPGKSKCNFLSKKTYFYWKHPGIALTLFLILVLTPFFYVVRLIFSILVIPLIILKTIKNKVTPNKASNNLIDDDDKFIV